MPFAAWTAQRCRMGQSLEFSGTFSLRSWVMIAVFLSWRQHFSPRQSACRFRQRTSPTCLQCLASSNMLGRMFLFRIPNQRNFKLTNWKNRWILDEAVILRLKLISVGRFNPVCQEGRVGTLGEYSVPERKECFLFWPLNKGRMNPGRNDLAEA